MTIFAGLKHLPLTLKEAEQAPLPPTDSRSQAVIAQSSQCSSRPVAVQNQPNSKTKIGVTENANDLAAIVIDLVVPAERSEAPRSPCRP